MDADEEERELRSRIDLKRKRGEQLKRIEALKRELDVLDDTDSAAAQLSEAEEKPKRKKRETKPKAAVKATPKVPVGAGRRTGPRVGQ